MRVADVCSFLKGWDKVTVYEENHRVLQCKAWELALNSEYSLRVVDRFAITKIKAFYQNDVVVCTQNSCAIVLKPLPLAVATAMAVPVPASDEPKIIKFIKNENNENAA